MSFFIDEVVALFYLNLLRLRYDPTFRDRIHQVYTDKPLENNHTKEMIEYIAKYSEFSDGIDESTEKLFEMINNDSQLQKLLKKFIVDIRESLNIPEFLENIESRIT